MTRNVRIPKEFVCVAEGCKFVAESRDRLLKHYQLDHTFIETMKASLTIKGWDNKIDK